MFEMLDCDIVVNEFDLHSRYYGHFWTNIIREDRYLLILLALD